MVLNEVEFKDRSTSPINNYRESLRSLSMDFVKTKAAYSDAIARISVYISKEKFKLKNLGRWKEHFQQEAKGQESAEQRRGRVLYDQTALRDYDFSVFNAKEGSQETLMAMENYVGHIDTMINEMEVSLKNQEAVAAEILPQSVKEFAAKIDQVNKFLADVKIFFDRDSAE
jgi:hypothetical protein